VVGEAQGEEESIQKFLKDIDNGPSAAEVVKLEKNQIDTKDGESSFEQK
jgi:acylphosphatase